jgi:hypothetical protein
MLHALLFPPSPTGKVTMGMLSMTIDNTKEHDDVELVVSRETVFTTAVE